MNSRFYGNKRNDNNMSGVRKGIVPIVSYEFGDGFVILCFVFCAILSC